MTPIELKHFLKDLRVLVIENLKPAHTKINETLVQLGIRAENIVNALDSIDGEVHFRENHFDIIFVSYEINETDGAQLIHKLKNIKNDHRTLGVLMSTTSSQNIVAKAVEFDVDLFVLKPYTYNSLYLSLSNLFERVNKPDPYIQKVQKGYSSLVEKKDTQEALKYFFEAIDYVSDSSLAYYYLGQTAEVQNLDDKALNQYLSALKMNEMHFKTLKALYSFYSSKKYYDETYNIVRMLIRYYPLNSERFCELIKLSIITDNIDDIPSYYNLFGELEEKTFEMRKFLSAGLFVNAKRSLANKDLETMKDTIDKFVKLSDKNPKFIKASVELFLEADLIKEAQKQLKLFKESDYETDAYSITHTLIALALEPTSRDIEKAISLMPLDESLCYWLNKVISNNKEFKKYFNQFYEDATKIHPEVIKQLTA